MKEKNTHLIIMDIFERVAHDTDTHVDQVRGGHFKDLFRELLAVLVDLLLTRQSHNTVNTN